MTITQRKLLPHSLWLYDYYTKYLQCTFDWEPYKTTLATSGSSHTNVAMGVPQRDYAQGIGNHESDPI